MNRSSRMKNFLSNSRRHSWSNIVRVPFYLSDDSENNFQDEDCPPQRISLTVRQPSFSFLSTNPAFDGKCVKKDGEELPNQNTIVFEPHFDRKISQYPYADVMRSLCNKSIYSDLSISNSANEDNNNINNETENTQLSMSLTLPSLFPEESFTDFITEPDDDFDQVNENIQLNSKMPRWGNSQIVMDLRKINEEKWNNIGYIPPNSE